MANSTITFDITSGYNPIRSQSITNQTAINCFVFEKGIFHTPGQSVLYSIADTAEARGILYSQLQKSGIFVIDDGVYRGTDSDHHRLFSIETLTDRVYLAENGNNTNPDIKAGNYGGQLLVADGSAIYVYTLDGKMNKAMEKSGTELPFKPDMIDYQDDYFFGISFSNNRLYASDLANGLAWAADSYTPLDFITKGLVAFQRMLVVFGENQGVIYHDAALSPFPYTKDLTRSWEYGCINAATISKGMGRICWLGGNSQSGPVVLASNGGDPVVISTPGIDHVIDNLTNPSDCEGFIYQIDGYIFYQLNFLSDNFSILYNFDKKKWYRVTDYRLKTHPIRKPIYYPAGNKLLAISNVDGKIYNFSSQITNENNNIVPRIIISNTISQDEVPFVLNRLDVFIEQGVNRNETQVAISISKDNGRTFFQLDRKNIGVPANRKNLLRFYKLGSARWWTLKIEFFSLDKMVILNDAIGHAS